MIFENILVVELWDDSQRGLVMNGINLNSLSVWVDDISIVEILNKG